MYKVVIIENRMFRTQFDFATKAEAVTKANELAKECYLEFASTEFEDAVESEDVVLADVKDENPVACFMNESWDCYVLESKQDSFAPVAKATEEATGLDQLVSLCQEANIPLAEIRPEALYAVIGCPEELKYKFGHLCRDAMYIEEGVEMLTFDDVDVQKCLDAGLFKISDLLYLGQESFKDPEGDRWNIIVQAIGDEVYDTARTKYAF